jgi:hypothetical protein
LSYFKWMRRASTLVALGALLALEEGCSPSSSVPHPTASTAPTPSTAPAPPPARADTVATLRPCRPRDPNQTQILASLVDALRQPEAGSYRTEQAQLFRFFPLLHEAGVVRSIAATHSTHEHGQVFALTLLVRSARGGMDAFLGFAAAPCPDGDLALLSAPVPLGAPDAIIEYTTRVPFGASTLTELQITAGDPPPLMGTPRVPSKFRSVVVGSSKPALRMAAPDGASFGVIGSVEGIDLELAPEAGVRRRDAHLFGSGWYAFDGGTAYLLVHHAVHDLDDACRLNRPARPASPPQLRLLARLDAQRGFTTDPRGVAVAYVVGIGENQPVGGVVADATHSLRIGPTSIADPYFDQGGPAQWLWGLFESHAAAKEWMRSAKYATGTVYATEPPSGTPAPKEPWTVNARRSTKATVDCDRAF